MTMSPTHYQPPSASPAQHPAVGRIRPRQGASAAPAALAGAAVWVVVTGLLAAGPALAVSVGAWSPLPTVDQSNGSLPDGLRDIACPATDSALHVCVAVGEDGEVFRTADGGATWTSPDSSTASQLNGVDCRDTTCVAVGLAGMVAHSSDQGNSWHSGVASTEHLDDVACADASVCYAVGDNGMTMKTTDGGANWTSQDSGTSKTLNGVSCPDTSNCYAAGESVIVLKTADGGTNWANVHGPEEFSGTHKGISCPTTDTCYAVGHEPGRFLPQPLIRVTTDGGSTWQTHEAPIPKGMADVACPTVAVCVAVGYDGAVVATGTGGAVGLWSPQFASTSGDLYGVDCTDAHACFAVASEVTGGTVFRSAQVNPSPLP